MPGTSSPVTSVVRGVPYIATWSGERTCNTTLTHQAKGLTFFDPRCDDRDRADVLWSRKAERLGRGKAQFAGVHPRRQRRAMQDLLCQVCGRSADVNDLGVLWLEPITPEAPLRGEMTHPPVCVPCAVGAMRSCPRLRRTGAHVLRVRHPKPWGVHGVLYCPALNGTLHPEEAVEVSYWDSEAQWVLATQMITTLDGATPVDLAEEHARYLARETT